MPSIGDNRVKFARRLVDLIARGGTISILGLLAGLSDRGATSRTLIGPLTGPKCDAIQLPPSSRFDRRLLAEHVRLNPSMAFASADGRQYAIAGRWRHRQDIAELLEASPGSLRRHLIEALVDDLTNNGFRLLILDYGVEANDPAFYQNSSFHLIERIIEFERPDMPVDVRSWPKTFTVAAYRPGDRQDVLLVEQQSFPWLWWNSREEWDEYVVTPGVEVLVGRLDERVVGYAGLSVHRREGHLDRLAVSRKAQGLGLGASLLSASLSRMAERGARHIALTTQEDNLRSQKLYEQNGFKRGRWTYEIYGRWLGSSVEVIE